MGGGSLGAARGGTGRLFLNSLKLQNVPKDRTSFTDKGKMAHRVQMTCQHYITSLAAAIPVPLLLGVRTSDIPLPWGISFVCSGSCHHHKEEDRTDYSGGPLLFYPTPRAQDPSIS